MVSLTKSLINLKYEGYSTLTTQTNYFVHESSCVDEGAQIGDGTSIWHFCHISGGVVIGRKCKFGQNVFVAGGSRIGNNVKVQNNVSIYAGVTLEDDVFCGPSMVFTNVATPRSAILRNTLDDYLPTLIKRGASIGANATIVCGHTIGEYAFIGAGSVVTKDVPAYALIYGNPARRHGWACECGLRLTFNAGTAACSCGRKYRQISDEQIERKA